MFSLSIKEILFFKLRYILIGFILFFVASLVFIISGLANGLANDNASSMQNMNVSSFYLSEDAENRMDRSQFSALDTEAMSTNNAQPLGIQMMSLQHKQSEKKVDVTLMAFNADHFLMPSITEGKAFTNHSPNNEVIVDRTLAKENVKIGDELYDENSQQSFKIVGFTENQTYSHTPTMMMNVNSWYALFGSKQQAHFNAIALNNDYSSTKSEVKNTLNNGVFVAKDDVIKTIPGYEAEQSSLLMMLAFLIIIAVFVLGAFFYIMTIQKINQFGILKAIGAKNKFLIGSTILQVFLLSVVSITLAIIFSYVLTLILPAGIPFYFDLLLICKFAFALLLVSLLGSLVSTISIIKVDPLQAMGRTE